MRILIDIVHPADVNFFKNALTLLRKKNNQIFVSVMQRGNLAKLVEEEFGKGAEVIGKHSGKGFIKKMICNIGRIIKLRGFIRKINPDAVASFSYYPSAAAFGMGIKSVAFHDDLEYKAQFLLCKIFATKFVVPAFLGIGGSNIRTYNFYKEMAYLSPEFFIPSKKMNPLGASPTHNRHQNVLVL